MDKKKIFLASLCAILIVIVQVNNIIACENEDEKENTSSENQYPSSSITITSLLNAGTLLDKLIERYPILDTIIQMILEMIQNFLSRINILSL